MASIALAAVLTVGVAGLLVWLSGRFGWHWGFGWLAAHGVVKAAIAIPVGVAALGAWWRRRRADGTPEDLAGDGTDGASGAASDGSTATPPAEPGA
ncbi:hypothetical protein OG871_20765 [Kitasatospora sp. NBC_00374]|uniref:hypothetical protein n=1 Tax=Kitasatospora sp. NBC_00374 TaxID=2975964 RepID=UPI0030E46FC0